MTSGRSEFKRRFSLRGWLLRHVQVMLYSLGRLVRKPLGTLLTTAVIGIAISLPVGLQSLVNNLQTLSENWQGASSLSVFLKTGLEQPQVDRLIQTLNDRPDIEKLSYISPQQALEEFRQFSGFGEALGLLQENPLPAVLLIRPARTHATPEQTARLAEQLTALVEVDMAQADLQWVRRFQGITRIIQRSTTVLAVLLALAVILIMGNTIRLEIQGRHKEIEIIKLVGGTNAFIRRPFLYEGFWYGLLGGVIAWLLLLVSFGLLSAPVAHLAGLYQSEFTLTSVSVAGVLTTLAGSALLGLAGAWLAVNRHLSDIEPQ